MADISSIKLNGNSYNIKDNNAVSKNDVIDIAHGGTGKATHTANAILTGNGTSAVKNVATNSGAFFATGTNVAPSFGTLPIAQGGTGTSTSLLFLRPGDSFTIGAGFTGFPGIPTSTTSCYFTIFTTYPIRSDVESATLTGSLSFRLAGKSRVNVSNVSLVSSSINRCGIVFGYTTTSNTFELADVVNVSFRLNAATITLS